MMRLLRRYRGWIMLLLVLGIAGLLFGLAYFQPQKLFLNERRNDPPPVVGVTGLAGTAQTRAADRILLSGQLRSLEHRSSGRVVLIALADDSRILRFEQLETSNGPDLHVYLSAVPASSSWYGYDRDFVDLGSLKGNEGNQNYLVPASVDLSRYGTAVIWCKRFSIGFAVASLAA